MARIRVRNFDLKKTVECGQIFRWEKLGDYYYITAGDRIIVARQDGDNLEFRISSGNSAFVRHYFSLDEDYSRIVLQLGRAGLPGEVISSAFGLRLIRQEPFECLISYVASSASNIPRIKRNLNLLSRRFGSRISFEGFETYSFPTPSELSAGACEKSLKKCGLGFRARFYPVLIGQVLSSTYGRTADQKFNRFFSTISSMPYEAAKLELMKLRGVGSKVADCVLAFSLGFGEAFPTDVWIRRAVSQVFFKGKNLSTKHAEEFGRKTFQKNSAYAQEFLYYWIRMKHYKA
ncbi:MAG: DNA glycosylase [Candidatus Woesearchaeota archaeon]